VASLVQRNQLGLRAWSGIRDRDWDKLDHLHATFGARLFKLAKNEVSREKILKEAAAWDDSEVEALEQPEQEVDQPPSEQREHEEVEVDGSEQAIEEEGSVTDVTDQEHLAQGESGTVTDENIDGEDGLLHPVADEDVEEAAEDNLEEKFYDAKEFHDAEKSNNVEDIDDSPEDASEGEDSDDHGDMLPPPLPQQQNPAVAQHGAYLSPYSATPLNAQPAPAAAQSVVPNQPRHQVALPVVAPNAVVVAPPASQPLPLPAQNTATGSQVAQPQPPPAAAASNGAPSRFRRTRPQRRAQPLTIDDFYPPSPSMAANRPGWERGHIVTSIADISSHSGFGQCKKGPIAKTGALQGDFLMCARNSCINDYLRRYHPGMQLFNGGGDYNRMSIWYDNLSVAEQNRLRFFIMEQVESALPAAYRALVDGLRQGLPQATVTALQQALDAWVAGGVYVPVNVGSNGLIQAAGAGQPVSTNAAPTGTNPTPGSAHNGPTLAGSTQMNQVTGNSSNGTSAHNSGSRPILPASGRSNTGTGTGMSSASRPLPHPPNTSQGVKRTREEVPNSGNGYDGSDSDNSQRRKKPRRSGHGMPAQIQAPHPPHSAQRNRGAYRPTAPTIKREIDEIRGDDSESNDEGTTRPHKKQRLSGNDTMSQGLHNVPRAQRQQPANGGFPRPSQGNVGPSPSRGSAQPSSAPRPVYTRVGYPALRDAGNHPQNPSQFHAIPPPAAQSSFPQQQRRSPGDHTGMRSSMIHHAHGPGQHLHSQQSGFAGMNRHPNPQLGRGASNMHHTMVQGGMSHHFHGLGQQPAFSGMNGYPNAGY
jgi:hypothetical protein